MPTVKFRLAREPREIEQVHALHYKAFVEEIPQYAPNENERHVDRFHDENEYIVALDGETVIGSIAVRGTRPFSLDGKLENLDQFLPAGYRYCEIRLLNVARDHRTGNVLPGLLAGAWSYATERGFDAAVISATTRQLKLYEHLGFVPFGPLVGTCEAPFQPMYLTVDAFREGRRNISSLFPAARGELVNLSTGPVAINADVVAAFGALPQSHRSPGFDEELRALKASLCALVNAPYVEVLLGSATLGNDAVAAQLSLLGTHGIVISNGEFGERLADHASRTRLDFEHVKLEWGEPFDVAAIAERPFDWIWITGCETSTGVLNDVAALEAICDSRGAKLCVDAVSAIGAVPFDLSNVWLATGASGKALASYPGLALVFHRDIIGVSGVLPRYLDLGIYARDGVPFTHSSNLVRALRAAVEGVEWTSRSRRPPPQAHGCGAGFGNLGFTIVGEGAVPAPHIVTLSASAARPFRGDRARDRARGLPHRPRQRVSPAAKLDPDLPHGRVAARGAAAVAASTSRRLCSVEIESCRIRPPHRLHQHELAEDVRAEPVRVVVMPVKRHRGPVFEAVPRQCGLFVMMDVAIEIEQRDHGPILIREPARARFAVMLDRAAQRDRHGRRECRERHQFPHHVRPADRDPEDDPARPSARHRMRSGAACAYGCRP